MRRGDFYNLCPDNETTLVAATIAAQVTENGRSLLVAYRELETEPLAGQPAFKRPPAQLHDTPEPVQT